MNGEREVRVEPQLRWPGPTSTGASTATKAMTSRAVVSMWMASMGTKVAEADRANVSISTLLGRFR